MSGRRRFGRGRRRVRLSFSTCLSLLASGMPWGGGDKGRGNTFECYVEMVKRNLMVDRDSRSTVDAVSGGISADEVRLLVFQGDLDSRTTAEVEVHHFG